MQSTLKFHTMRVTDAACNDRIGVSLLLFVVFVALAFVLKPTIASAQNTQIGIVDSNLSWMSQEERLNRLWEIKNMGATTARVTIYWNEIEVRKGEPNWVALERLFSDFRLHGIEPLPVLFLAPDWAY